ncbi:hypothetical protein N7486_006411 [Penicillium sp. IBT 16267x]|nr:hypothetical protein N7486_006411 [Penicillium sp. IBT 16267x]
MANTKSQVSSSLSMIITTLGSLRYKIIQVCPTPLSETATSRITSGPTLFLLFDNNEVFKQR